MYGFTSQGKRRRLHALVIIDMVAAVLIWTSASAGGNYAWAFQLVGVLLAGIGVYLITRYSLRSYAYEVRESDLIDSEGGMVRDFVITQMLGNKQTVVARVAVRDIRAIQILSRADFRKKRKQMFGGATLFRYDNDPFSPLALYIHIPDENALLAIPPDPGMIDYLRRLGVGDATTRKESP